MLFSLAITESRKTTLRMGVMQVQFEISNIYIYAEGLSTVFHYPSPFIPF